MDKLTIPSMQSIASALGNFEFSIDNIGGPNEVLLRGTLKLPATGVLTSYVLLDAPRGAFSPGTASEYIFYKTTTMAGFVFAEENKSTETTDRNEQETLSEAPKGDLLPAPEVVAAPEETKAEPESISNVEIEPEVCAAPEASVLETSNAPEEDKVKKPRAPRTKPPTNDERNWTKANAMSAPLDSLVLAEVADFVKEIVPPGYVAFSWKATRCDAVAEAHSSGNIEEHLEELSLGNQDTVLNADGSTTFLTGTFPVDEDGKYLCVYCGFSCDHTEVTSNVIAGTTFPCHANCWQTQIENALNGDSGPIDIFA